MTENGIATFKYSEEQIRFAGHAQPRINEYPTPEAVPAPPPDPAIPKVATPRKLVLRSMLSYGDIVCMTAMVRDLHAHYPGRYITDVVTPFPEIWFANPHVTRIEDHGAPDVTTLDCEHPAVHQCNQRPVHLCQGYAEYLAGLLGLPHLHLTAPHGEIHLGHGEMANPPLPTLRDNVQRYWILCQGGKRDYSVKWLIPEVLEKVVAHFRGRIQFVQVGVSDDHWHVHEPIEGCLDLIGKTSGRQLINLVHHASGVLCGITAVMHLAAAVPRPEWLPARHCVVVAGGREPRCWYSYATHRILETVGQLPCCATGGCWKSRTVRMMDNDKQENLLCARVINEWPACMWAIKPAQIIAAIEGCLETSAIR